MGFDFEERRKSFLCADLFKQEENSVWRSPNSDSSSSGFTTPFGSELDSSESDDADFAAELSRQMAECMLHEEDEQQTNSLSEYGFNSNRPILDHVNRTPCIKVIVKLIIIIICLWWIINWLFNHLIYYWLLFQLKNQSAVGVSRGGRVKGAELTQQMQTRKKEPYRDGDWRSGSGRKGHTGSGMRAIFLGGPGSKNGSSGTGVFLPRVTNNPVEKKKKSGIVVVYILNSFHLIQSRRKWFRMEVTNETPFSILSCEGIIINGFSNKI